MALNFYSGCLRANGFRKLIPAGALIAVAVFISSGCASYFVYKPLRDMLGAPSDRGLAYEPVSLKTSDGIKLTAWWVPSPQQRGVVLFCPGNGGNISHHLDSLVIYHQLGLSTLTFNYRGYGDSRGCPTEQGTYRDAEAAWRYLVNIRRIPPGKIIIIGRSLGGSIAAYLAQNHHPGGLVIESAFTSLYDKAREVSPSIPEWYVASHRYDTLRYLQVVSCPILVVHSRDDEVIPFHHGQRLYEAAEGPKSFAEIRGSHNEGFFIPASMYPSLLDAFVGKYLNP